MTGVVKRRSMMRIIARLMKAAAVRPQRKASNYTDARCEEALI
jgi:hypothetical protein